MKKSSNAGRGATRKRIDIKPNGQPSITSFLEKKSLFTTIKPSNEQIPHSSLLKAKTRSNENATRNNSVEQNYKSDNVPKGESYIFKENQIKNEVPNTHPSVKDFRISELCGDETVTTNVKHKTPNLCSVVCEDDNVHEDYDSDVIPPTPINVRNYSLFKPAKDDSKFNIKESSAECSLLHVPETPDPESKISIFEEDELSDSTLFSPTPQKPTRLSCIKCVKNNSNNFVKEKFSDSMLLSPTPEKIVPFCRVKLPENSTKSFLEESFSDSMLLSPTPEKIKPFSRVKFPENSTKTFEEENFLGSTPDKIKTFRKLKFPENSIKTSKEEILSEPTVLSATPRKIKTFFDLKLENGLEGELGEDSILDESSFIPPTPLENNSLSRNSSQILNRVNGIHSVSDLCRPFKRGNENISPNSKATVNSSAKKTRLFDAPQVVKRQVLPTPLNLDQEKNSIKSDSESSEDSPYFLNKNITSLECCFDLSLDFDQMSPFKMSQEKEEFPEEIIRYIVTSVFLVSDYEKVIIVAPDIENKETQLRRTCILKEMWADTPLKEKDVVHILDADFEKDTTILTNQNGFIVVNPDVLISCTAICSTIFCQRKTVLAEIFKGWDQGNQAMLLGCIVHQIFQETVKEKIYSLPLIEQKMHEVLHSPKILQDMYSLQIEFNKLKALVSEYVIQIKSWVDKFYSGKATALKDSTDAVEFLNVRDIEDNFWSPTLGLKGKIDVTGEVKIHSKGQQRTKLFPIELKTGRPSFSVEHQGQVILYSMMMNERYTDPEGGFLLYLQGGPLMKFTQTQRTNKSGLLQMRNKLSKYLSSYHNGIPEFPDPSSRYNFCEKCPMLLPCSLAERAFEGEKNLSSAKERQELVMGATRHLSNPHLTYFRHWFGLIHLEALAIAERNGNKAFWSIPAPKREDKGMCLCNLRIAKVEAVTNLSDPIKHTFSKLDGCSKLTTAAFRINDTLVVSTENSPSEIAIAIGSVSAITEFEIQLLLDKNLTSRPDWSKETFTIDIYNSASLIATNFRNVARLMMNNPKVNRLRALIIDKEEPNYLPGLTKKQAQVVKSIVKGLNKNQLQALFKSLLVQDYVLIQGMPGTELIIIRPTISNIITTKSMTLPIVIMLKGKTYTIICIVKSLVALGLSVLLTSYTNSAVDNILLKLKDSGVDFMRMGRASKVHPDLSQQTADSKTASIKSPEDLAKLYNSVHVVATTCLSVNDAIFHRRTFDVCIVDEASQILQPVCLGPLFLAKSFILVGDSKQLPPLAQSFTAREKGICESLFSSLERTKNVVELNMQYRMNSEIMDVSNKLTYDNKLIAGNAEVANSTLQIKLEHEPEGLWSKILSNELRDSVVFLNTNEITSEETNNKQGLISNKYEAAIVVSIVEQLVKIGKLCVDDLGIISPYRDQIRLITEKLQKLSLSVEINTVDQYQGRDKNVIIFSCVRSSVAPSGNDVNVGEILQDSKRLNVALTRAKTKLILIGDQETLKNYMPFANLFKILRLDQIVTINESFLFKDLKCFI